MLDHRRRPTWEELQLGSASVNVGDAFNSVHQFSIPVLVHPENHARPGPSRPFEELEVFEDFDMEPSLGQSLEHTKEQDPDNLRYVGVGEYELKPHQISGIAWMLSKENKDALTGGGIVADKVGQNTVYDVYSLLLVLNPPNIEDFRRQIELMAVNGDSPLVETARRKLRALLRPLLLRRLRNDKVDGENILHLKPYSKRPPREIATCELDANERIVYEMLQDCICDILKHFGHREWSTKCVFVLILRLRQACLHPRLLLGPLQRDAEEPLDGEEMCELNEASQYSDGGASEMAKTSRKTGEAMGYPQSCKCGLAQDTSIKQDEGRTNNPGKGPRRREDDRVFDVPELLKTLLREVLECDAYKFKCVQYDGSMDRKSRDAALDAIKRGTGGVNIILMSMMAGSSAECNHVIFTDIWWNPAVEVSTYRSGAMRYPPSQLTTRKVYVHKLVAKNTIESRILAVQQGKRELAKKVLARGRNEEMGNITLEELRAPATGKTS
ncbi:hypothetical protein AAF712_012422 [Marasmius tenuissimus]|uniref:Helicase C-terminal domain-containing protein n=1 Tax=Marasmius tenuissimus TaxID=585030 RepID=A0ABR2ZIK1_9AGAR